LKSESISKSINRWIIKVVESTRIQVERKIKDKFNNTSSVIEWGRVLSWFKDKLLSLAKS
jgi:hypothetical protein